jgi:hypothetical protein
MAKKANSGVKSNEMPGFTTENAVNGITESMIARYYIVDQSVKELTKEKDALGSTIKKMWPDNKMHILGPYAVEKKVTTANIVDKDILLKLLVERLGADEANEMFELSKTPSPRVSLTVKKAA